MDADGDHSINKCTKLYFVKHPWSASFERFVRSVGVFFDNANENYVIISASQITPNVDTPAKLLLRV